MFKKSFFVFTLVFTSLSLLTSDATEVKTVSVQLFANSENAGYETYRAMDGDPNTMWHTQFSAEPRTHLCPHPIACGYHYACGYDHPSATIPVSPGYMPLPLGAKPSPWGNPPDDDKEIDAAQAELFGIAQKSGNRVPGPHALGIDLGNVYPLTGFTYTPRTDSRSGTFEEYELYVAKDAVDGKAAFGEPIARGKFSGKETNYLIDFGRAVETRYVKFVGMTSLDKSPVGSVAECQPIAAGYRFVASKGGQLQPDAKLVVRMPNTPGDPETQEQVDEWNLLAERFKTPLYWNAIKEEVVSQASLILPEDRDPVDVMWRRLSAMRKDMGIQWVDPQLEARVKNTPVEDPYERFNLFRVLCSGRKHFLLLSDASPLKNAPKEILFVKRHRSCCPHMCDQFYGTNQRPGGGLFVLNVETGEVRNLLENSTVESGRLKGQKLDKGSFLSPDVSFDGKKIAFAYVECVEPETPVNLHNMTHDITRSTHVDTLDVTRGHWDIGRSYHIFTCNADGSELRQITDGTWNDFDPCWLPNGRLAFITERRNGYLRCGRECPTYTLFDMNPDGTQMRPLSFHETNEWNPSVTNDGKILYTRWDYVDRYGCTVHHPWVTTLDGRDPREVHGNYSHRHRRPDTEFDCRAIPDSHKYIATGGPHHGQSFGSIVMIDPRAEDDDGMGPVKRLTPDVGFPESQGGGQVYGTPWALSENYFLCVADFAYQPDAMAPGAIGGPNGRGNDGIYLCDIHGNRELIYRDPAIACISPMPLAARPMPHFLPTTYELDTIEHQPYLGLREGGRIYHREVDGDVSKSQHTQATGTLSLANIYDSLRPFPEGAKIKELRIIQLLPMTVPSGAPPHQTGMREGASGDSVNLARWVLGTVPVEEDGSAHFEMPAQIEFQFQALDENGLAVQSMRSSSYVQPGESVSCVGCHERKNSTPPMAQSKAMLRPASKIKPETVPGAYPFSYPRLVQPVLDKHCVDCHADPESKTFSLAKDPIADKFYASYNNLARPYGFTTYGDPLRTIPGRFGARAAPLYRILKEGHYDVKLSDEEMHRIVLWLDCLSNFYGVYEKEGGEAQLQGKLAWPTLE
ncbi:MAG: discoidin domain-containing protein [Planctomycetaceae bacterium]|nr:discoidin domain-containing protein [Planctomycetaceae bacterium]